MSGVQSRGRRTEITVRSLRPVLAPRGHGFEDGSVAGHSCEVVVPEPARCGDGAFDADGRAGIEQRFLRVTTAGGAQVIRVARPHEQDVAVLEMRLQASLLPSLYSIFVYL